MNRLVLAFILAVGLGGFGAAHANAVFCIDLTDFCDDLQVEITLGNVVFGKWDAFCDGNPRPVLGHKINRVIIVGAEINDIVFPAGSGSSMLSFEFKSRSTGRVFDEPAYDGVNPPFHFQENSPWTLIDGPCTFSEGARINRAEPRSTD